MPLTVFDVLQSLFPEDASEAAVGGAHLDANGAIATGFYVGWPHAQDVATDWPIEIELLGRYAKLPQSPFDLFAFTAHLIETSGAYHHVMLHQKRAAPDDGNRSSHHVPRRRLLVDREQLRLCRRWGRIWRKHLDIDNPRDVLKRSEDLADVAKIWLELLWDFGERPVFEPIDQEDPPPAWWIRALQLLIVADEASNEACYEISTKTGSGLWFARDWERLHVSRIDSVDVDPVNSLSAANMDVVCVMPKARTTPVGCTLRSLTHNLALLPPRGIARARWTPLIHEGTEVIKFDNEFNLLLVPFPFSVSDTDFDGRAGKHTSSREWSLFECRQGWLPRDPDRRRSFIADLAEFVQALASEAIKTHQARRIDAVVFPELALDYEIFAGLRDRLPLLLRGLRMIIAGLSSDDRGRFGNFVGVTSFLDVKADRPVLESIREKHHRWMIDRQQIEDYGLEGVLDPRQKWWERIDLLSRRVDFTVFQPGSVMSAMICEDLARVDPCQELLRSVGPNLVIALLMDAPQLQTRWPARYATVLAEDPGSSVLTLTSRGLMARQHLLGLPKHVRREDVRQTIALWRDDHYGRPEPIECPFSAHGVWLKLLGMPTKDQTLDGRKSDSTLSWIRAKFRPLQIVRAETDFSTVVGPVDQEVRRAMLRS